MTTQSQTTMPPTAMSALDAIYHRRSVRDFASEPIDPGVIRALLDAAVHAPTAMHEEPWAFVIIEDKKQLDRLSESVREQMRVEARNFDAGRSKHLLELVNQPDFNAFYNAGVLIVICRKFEGPFVEADCWLAAENLMLAACANGLATCVIGLAVSALNTPAWKAELQVPAGMATVAPIIVGVAARQIPAVPRKPPEILNWR